MSLLKIYFNNGAHDSIALAAYCDNYATYSQSTEELLAYISLITSSDNVKRILSLFRGGLEQIDIYSTFYSINPKNYTYTTYHTNGMGHIVFRRKSCLTEGSYPILRAPLFLDAYAGEFSGNKADAIPAEVIDKTYQDIIENTSIPMLEDWKVYISHELARHYAYEKVYINRQCSEHNLNYEFQDIRVLCASVEGITAFISKGLREGAISIDGCNSVSEKFLETSGLDSYLENFGQILANRVSEKFSPLFDPSKEQISSKVKSLSSIIATHSTILPYEAQENTIEAAVRSMNINKHTNISGEMGVGRFFFMILA